MKRRTLLLVLLGLALSAMRGVGFADSPGTKPPVLITILHTNDLHGHVSVPSKDQGLARIATLVQPVRAQMPHVLLLDSGDTIQSTPTMKLFGGRPIIEPMNRIRYDAATLGNHEFDHGIDVLKDAMSLATFAWVSANVIDTRTGEPWNGVKPYVIQDIAGVRVALFGLTTVETVQIEWPRTLDGVEFRDPIQVARDLVPRLRNEEHADLVLCLSHLGMKMDHLLAAAVPGIDVIVGGHSHTPLDPPHWQGDTLIVQSGPHAKSLGRVDLLMQPQQSGYHLGAVNGRNGKWWGHDGTPAPENMDAALFPAGPLIMATTDVAEDADVIHAYAPYDKLTRQRLNEVLTLADEPLTATDATKTQVPIGSLLAEAIRSQTQAELAALASNEIDPKGLLAGPVRVGDLYRLLGGYSSRHLVIVRATGAAIRELSSHAVNSKKHVFQTAGFEIANDGTVRVGGEPLDNERQYIFAAPAHIIRDHLLGKRGVEILYDDPRGPGVRDAAIEFLRRHPPLKNQMPEETRPATQPLAEH